MKGLQLLLSILFPLTFFCQETPPILKFSPNTYMAENQNWAISQNNDKFIFVANNEGLLEYNGATWKLYPSPNNTILRSVKAVDDKIYTGAYMEFGYWQRTSQGLLEYHSLSAKIPKNLLEDNNFWTIETHENWILFQSNDRIYFYNTKNEEINYLTDKNNYLRIFKLNNNIYIHKRDNKIYRIEGDEEVELAVFPDEFDVKLVLNIFQIEESILVLTRNEGFFIIRDGIIEKWNIPADSIITSSHIFSGIQLSDNTFMLGTISNGLIHLSADGKIINTIDQSNGLSNNTVLNLFEDDFGNVWVALDNGIDCLNMPSFIREYNDYGGTVGTTYASIIYDDKLYIGTNQGLFYKSAFSNELLKPVIGTKGQVWSLYEYNGDLLCGHTLGTFLIKDGSSFQFSDILGTWGFREIPKHPNTLLLGHYSGMSIIAKENGAWKLKHKIKNFENSARFFEVMGDDEVWVNHEYKGIYKLKLNSSLTEFEEVALYSELPKGKGSGLLKYSGELLYSFEEGVFKLDTIKQQFVKDTVLNKLILNDKYVSGKLVKDDKDKLWGFNRNSIGYAQKGPIPGKTIIKFIPIQNSLRKVTVSFENITYLQDNKYIIGKTNGYILADLNLYQTEPHTVYLNNITFNQNDTLRSAVLFDKGTFEYRKNYIKFNYSVPSYCKYEFIYFQYKLEGYNDNWSDWTVNPEVSYEKLPFGNYSFKVRSKIGSQVSDNIASYDFTIERPKFLSNLALIGYILLLSVLAFITHRMYKIYYKKEHLKIVQENLRQYEINSMQNEQELVKLKNERLSHEIEAKNRELAISTMNIIKRNQFLRSMKKELKKTNSLEESHPVFKLIERNLNSAKDWNLFKDAFNTADKDFLKRAKELHPNLTHNDLKFCAYLRLNLTSKEIAPLLNISTKSVEVRRYRLRKKLKISHKVNLTDYIINI